MPPASIAIFAVILLVFSVAAWFALRGGRRLRESVCAQCRYPTGDITRLICPECGNDLRVVGIVTPRIRARMAGSFLGVVVAWTLIAVFISMLAGTLVMNLGAQWRTTAHDATFQPVAPIGSRPVTTVNVEEVFAAPDNNRVVGTNMPFSLGAEMRTAGTLTVVDHLTGKRAVADVRRAGVYFGGGVMRYANIDAPMVTEWLVASGVSGVSASEIAALVTAFRFAEVGSLIESLEGQPIFSRTGTGYSTITTSRRGPLLAGSIAAVMFVVWILGIVRLARMMRIPVRGAVSADQPPPAPSA